MWSSLDCLIKLKSAKFSFNILLLCKVIALNYPAFTIPRKKKRLEKSRGQLANDFVPISTNSFHLLFAHFSVCRTFSTVWWNLGHFTSEICLLDRETASKSELAWNLVASDIMEFNPLIVNQFSRSAFNDKTIFLCLGIIKIPSMASEERNTQKPEIINLCWITVFVYSGRGFCWLKPEDSFHWFFFLSLTHFFLRLFNVVQYHCRLFSFSFLRPLAPSYLLSCCWINFPQ